MTEIYIEDYSEKSFVVLGDTKPHKEHIKKLGGKWNSRLKDGKMGWIFPMSKKEYVEKYIKNFKKTGKISEIEAQSYNQSKTFSMSQKDLENILKRLEKLEQEVLNLRQEVKYLKSNKKFELEIDNYKDEKPKRRLLKKL